MRLLSWRILILWECLLPPSAFVGTSSSPKAGSNAPAGVFQSVGIPVFRPREDGRRCSLLSRLRISRPVWIGADAQLWDG